MEKPFYSVAPKTSAEHVEFSGRETMNDATLVIEHEEPFGWRYMMRDADRTPVLMSTKYYNTFGEVVEDLKVFQGLADEF